MFKQVLTGHLGSVGAGVYVIWVVLEQVFTGDLGIFGAGVYRSSVQCCVRCLQVICAVLGQVFTGHLCSVGAGVYWSSRQLEQVFTGGLGSV